MVAPFFVSFENFLKKCHKCFFVCKMCFNIASTIKKNDMDLIYLIILTPTTIAVMYAWHCIKQNTKRFEKIEEAKPYQFERDEYIPEFNEFTQMLVQRKMYKGKNK